MTTLVLEFTWEDRMALIAALTLAVRHEQREVEGEGPLHLWEESHRRCILTRARCWLDLVCQLEISALEREVRKLVDTCEARV